MNNNIPQPVSATDARLDRTINQGQKIVVGFLVIVVGVLLIVSGYLLVRSAGEAHRTTTRINQTTVGLCAFYHDIGTAPLPTPTSTLGATIVVHSRNAYVGLGCLPHLPAPTPTLRAVATANHLRLDG